MKKYYFVCIICIIIFFMAGCGNKKITENSPIKNVSQSNNKDLLFNAICQKDVDQVRELVDKCKDINLKDQYGNTYLFYAVQFPDAEIVKTLIDKGADVNTINKQGDSALYYAVKSRNEDVVKLLIENNVNLNYRNSSNGYDTALIEAIMDSNVSMAKLLIDSGADVNFPDKNGESPLLIADYFKLSEISKLLKEKGAQANRIDVHLEDHENEFIEGKKYFEKGDYLNTKITLSKLIELKDFKHYKEVRDMYQKSSYKLAIQYMNANDYEQTMAISNEIMQSYCDDEKVFRTFFDLYEDAERKYDDKTADEKRRAFENMPDPAVGMTADEVRNSKWGSPESIKRTTTKYGTDEQWIYSGNRYIYLENGIVTAIQESIN